jgi:hypothetical protein
VADIALLGVGREGGHGQTHLRMRQAQQHACRAYRPLFGVGHECFLEDGRSILEAWPTMCLDAKQESG